MDGCLVFGEQEVERELVWQHFILPCALRRSESGESGEGGLRRGGSGERGPLGITWEKGPHTPGRPGSERVQAAKVSPGPVSRSRLGLREAGSAAAGPALRARGDRGCRVPAPAAPALRAGKPANPPGTKAGLLPEGKLPTVWLLFFFFSLQRAVGQVWGPGGAGYPHAAHAGQGRGACAGRDAGGRGRPRSLARAGLRGNGLAAGRAREARAAAAAISAASCSSRPRRHGNRVTQRGGFPAGLARVTPAARAPASLTRRAPSPGPPPGHPGPAPRAPAPRVPAPPRAARARRPGGREIDGGRLLKNIVTVSVFITLTRERYLLLLFAERARQSAGGLGVRGCPLVRGSWGGRGWEREAGLRRDPDPAPWGPAPRPFPQPARQTPPGRLQRPVARVEGERLQNRKERMTSLRKALSRVDQFPGGWGGTPRCLWKH